MGAPRRALLRRFLGRGRPGAKRITTVGVERLPAPAYPSLRPEALRTVASGSTFHGLQWPYNARRNGRPSFVVGISGWGSIDTAYEKFGPWGATRVEQSRIRVLEAAGADAGAHHAHLFVRGNHFIQGQVELVGTGTRRFALRHGRRRHRRFWLRIGRWDAWDFQVGRFEAGRCFTWAWASTLTPRMNGAFI